MAAGEVLIYARAVFDEQLLGTSIDDTDWTGSLNTLLESRGHHLASAVIDIQAASLPSEISRQAALPEETAWLLFSGTNFDTASRPILFAHDYFRSDIRTLRVVQRNESM
jgi:GntR family transcriptional regulator